MAMNELSIQAQGVRHAIHTVFKSAAERVMPIRSASGFKTQGVRCCCAMHYCVSIFSRAV